MSLAKRILSDAARFSSSNYVYFSLKIASSIVFRRVLAPVLMGHVSLLFMIIEYCKYSHLGLLNALDREIPYHTGKKDLTKRSEVKEVSFNFYFFSTLLVTLGVCGVYVYLHYIQYDPQFLNGFLFVPLLLISYMFLAYFRVVLRSQHKFSLLSKFNVFFALTETLFSIVFVILWGVKGIILALALAFVLGALYLWTKGDFSLTIHLASIRLAELKRLLRIGFPLLLYDIIRMIFLSIDKIMILSLLGLKALGMYSVATMAFNFLMPLPRSVYNVISPRFYEAYGAAKDITQVKKYLLEPTMIMAYGFSIVVGISALFLTPLIYHILPLYRDGISTVGILIFSACFYSINFMWGYFLIALHKQMRMVQFNIIGVLVGIGLNYLCVRGLNLGLEAVAFSTTVTYALLSTIFITYVHSFYTKRWLDHARLLARLYLPIFWVIVVVGALRTYFPFAHVSLLKDLIQSGMLSIALFVCCLPMILYVNNKSQLLTLAVNMIRERRKKGSVV